MIALDAADIFVAGLLVFLAPVLLAWVGFEMERVWSEQRENRGLSQCRLCGNILSGVRRGETHRCRACGALNETSKFQTF